MIDCAISQFAFMIVQVGKLIDSHNPAITALAGIAVAVFTYILAKAAARADKHFAVTERAYFQMSHCTGITVPGNNMLAVSMQIRNWGKTPGTVTDQVLGLLVLPKGKKLPPDPIYDLTTRDDHQIFLVPTAFYNWDRVFEMKDNGMVPDILSGEISLYLLGYVDYRDQFGGRYRAGYARTFVHDSPRGANNLFYVTAPGYNYDRPRKPGEGRDWGD